MAKEGYTREDRARLRKAEIDYRVDTFKRDKDGASATNSLLRNGGFFAGVAGVATILAAPALVTGLSATAIALIVGEAAYKVGFSVMGVGMLKTVYDRYRKA